MKAKRGAQAVEQAGRAAIARAAVAGPPKDEYGELADVLRAGRRAAADLGHKLGNWKRRVYAPDTAATAYCTRCRLAAAVNLDVKGAAIGPAVTVRCGAAS